jgi:hypothetical protein
VLLPTAADDPIRREVEVDRTRPSACRAVQPALALASRLC